MKPQGSGLKLENISIHNPVDHLHRDLGLQWLKPFPWFGQEWFYSSLPWIFNTSHLIFIQFSRDCSSLPKWYVLGPTENASGRTTKNRCGNLETHWTSCRSIINNYMQYVGKTWQHQELNSTIRIDKSKETNKPCKSAVKPTRAPRYEPIANHRCVFESELASLPFGASTQRQQIYENLTERKPGMIWELLQFHSNKLPSKEVSGSSSDYVSQSMMMCGGVICSSFC